jgi:predicted transcriptional regulator
MDKADGAGSLIVPCEVAVKSVVPAVKALITKELVEKHNLKQDEVAELLGISQSAVSKYSNKVRGYVINVEEIQQVQPFIDKMIILLVKGDYPRQEFLGLFCQACAAVRRTNLMCQFCRKTNSRIEIRECGFCLSR